MKPNFSSVILQDQVITNGNLSKPGMSCLLFHFIPEADPKASWMARNGNETEIQDCTVNEGGIKSLSHLHEVKEEKKRIQMDLCI